MLVARLTPCSDGFKGAVGDQTLQLLQLQNLDTQAAEINV